MLRFFLVLISAGLLAFPAQVYAQAATSLAEFEQRLSQGLADGGDYAGFVDVIDPNNEYRDALEALVLVIDKKYDGAPLDFTLMSKRQTVPTGAQLIGVVSDDEDAPVVYLAMVLVQLGGNWRVIQFSAESSYKKLLDFH